MDRQRRPTHEGKPTEQQVEYGLRAKPPRAAVAYRTPAVDLGRCRVGSLDDVAEVLAVAEGEDFR